MVLSTSIEPYSMFRLPGAITVGGMILVIEPTSSFLNASSLNPEAARACCPKLELEADTENSPPLSVTY